VDPLPRAVTHCILHPGCVPIAANATEPWGTQFWRDEKGHPVSADGRMKGYKRHVSIGRLSALSVDPVAASVCPVPCSHAVPPPVHTGRETSVRSGRHHHPPYRPASRRHPRAIWTTSRSHSRGERDILKHFTWFQESLFYKGFMMSEHAWVSFSSPVFVFFEAGGHRFKSCNSDSGKGRRTSRNPH
jgi:hypothetical protein